MNLRKRATHYLLAAGILAGFLTLGLFSSSVIAEEIRYDRGDRRDPFIPLVGPGGVVNVSKLGSKDISIEGIVYDPNGGSMVLINGEFYKEGDSVKGANVISIFHDHVILNQDKEDQTFWIREETVSDTAKVVQKKKKKAGSKK